MSTKGGGLPTAVVPSFIGSCLGVGGFAGRFIAGVRHSHGKCRMRLGASMSFGFSGRNGFHGTSRWSLLVVWPREALAVVGVGFDVLTIVLVATLFSFDSYDSSSSTCLPPGRTVVGTLGRLCPNIGGVR